MKKRNPLLGSKLVNSIYIVILAGLAVAAWTDHGYSAYDRSIGHQHLKPVDMNVALRSAYNSPGNLYDPIRSEAAIERALMDADHMINPEFHVPAEIRTVVKFWLRIYTQYSTQNIVFFDSNNMDIIYEVLDFAELKDKARNAVVYEITSNNKIKRTLELYRKAFASLVRNPHPKHPTPQEKVILSKFKNPSRKKLLEANANFKYMRGQRDNIMSGILAAESFLPKMEMIFRKMDVPVELTRLSLVESSFNLRATSKVGASGVWQFMPGPGKKYLMINEKMQIDERRSPLKSTVAAAKLLRWNYRYLGSWPLAVIAYNHGLKNLPRLKGARNDFSRIAYLFRSNSGAKGLGWASRNYYGELLGALYAESYRHLFFGEIPSSGIRPITFEQLQRNQSALTFVIEKGLPLEEFRFLNADIEDIHQVLPKGFWVAVPGYHDNINRFVDIALDNRKSKSVTAKRIPTTKRRKQHS